MIALSLTRRGPNLAREVDFHRTRVRDRSRTAGLCQLGPSGLPAIQTDT